MKIRIFGDNSPHHTLMDTLLDDENVQMALDIEQTTQSVPDLNDEEADEAQEDGIGMKDAPFTFVESEPDIDIIEEREAQSIEIESKEYNEDETAAEAGRGRIMSVMSVSEGAGQGSAPGSMDQGQASAAVEGEGEGAVRKYGEEGPEDENWRKHKKHFFVFSHSGKPIYTRYGHEEKLVTFTGLLLALISFVNDQDPDDSLRVVSTAGCKVVFLTRIPLHLVCVSQVDEPVGHLERQLLYMHDQIIALLTTGFAKIFETRSTYDLRNLLGGAERFLDNLVSERESPLDLALSAVQCVRMDQSLRNTIGASLQLGKSASKDLLFAVLLHGKMLVSMVRPKRFPLQPADVHILSNFITSNAPSFRATESWTPICLPHFNDKGFLHAYIAFLAPDTCPDLCLVLLSTRPDGFHDLQIARQKIGDNLTQTGSITALKTAIDQHTYSIADVGAPGALHFVYKSLHSLQYTSPEPLRAGPYSSKAEFKRLIRAYIRTYHRVHSSVDGLKTARLGLVKPIKIMMASSDSESMLAWITARFELYATYGPLVTKSAAITTCNRLLSWVRREEERLFVRSSPVW